MAQIFDPHFQAVDAAGMPVSGANLYFYVAGTTTLITVYQDAGATTPHTNPVVADASGLFPPIYGNTGAFKSVLKTSSGVTIQTVDNQWFGIQSGSISTADLADGAVTRVKISDAISDGIGFSPSEFSGVGDGVTDDTAAVNAAIAAAGTGGLVYLPEDMVYLVSAYSNTTGARIEGPGQIVTPVTGGQRQRNIYADLLFPHLGHENLNRVYQYMNLGQGSALGTFYVRIFGDSTATDAYGDYGPTAVVRKAFGARGIPNQIIENYAVSGTRWDQFDPTGLITGTALFIISYGVNDPANGSDMDSRLAALIANMDAKLSSVRATANAGTLGIILKMPNSTSDSPNNRDERWYEKIKTIYVAMARKYDCAVFDTYGQFWNSRTAAGKWMDDPYGDGRAVHPASAMNNWVWGRMIDEFFPVGAVSMYATNLVSNQGAVSSSLAASAAPSAFDEAIAIYRATTANGWPLDGFVRVTHNVDSGVLQELFNYANGSTMVMSRTAYIAGDSWNPWSGVPAAVTLSNGWVNQGAPWQVPICTKSADGLVIVEGLINGGTVTAGTVLGTLPPGYRPSAASIYRVATNAGQCTLSVNADGTIKAHTAADGTFTSLSGISFMAA